MQLLDAPLAIVDLETTGAHPAHARVTEIAVIEVDDGEVTGEWSTLPAHLERAMVDAIPDAPGVYLFYGEGAAPLYVGKSIAMRTRVLQHFDDDVRSSKQMQLVREVRRIEWQRTAGELAALKNLAWPWRGPVGVVEEDEARESTDLHVIHHWCYLGTARSEDEVPGLLEGRRRLHFDLDQYRILSKHLAARRTRVVVLPCTPS